MEPDEFLIKISDSSQIKIAPTEENAHQFADYGRSQMETIKKAIKAYDSQLQQPNNPSLTQLFHEFEVKTPSGLEISASHFDRNSDVLVVAGQGFQHTKKSVYALAALYPNCDVVTFNYRWARLWQFALKPSTLYRPLTELLLNEYEEVSTVVLHMKQKKSYRSVIGHAICYSTYPFIAAQAESQEKLFDKIILDSTFATTPDIIEKIIQDPLLFCNPQVNHSPSWFKTLLRYLYIPQLIRLLAQRYAHASIPSLLKTIKKTPLMLIHGKNDVIVPLINTFNTIWQAASETVRFAYLTPYQHVMNLPKNRGLYRKVCELFIHYAPEEFPQQFPLTAEWED